MLQNSHNYLGTMGPLRLIWEPQNYLEAQDLFGTPRTYLGSPGINLNVYRQTDLHSDETSSAPYLKGGWMNCYMEKLLMKVEKITNKEKQTNE